MPTEEFLREEKRRQLEKLLALANLQRMRKQWADAEDTCQKAVELEPTDVVAREMLGDLLYESGKLDKALEEYRIAQESAPGNPSLEKKFAKTTLAIAEREHEKAVAQDMIDNPHRYITRQRKPGLALLLALIPGLGQLYNHDLVKAGVVGGSFLLFLISYVLLQQPYPKGISSTQDFIHFTNPLVLVLGFLSMLTYVYGFIDAPLSADKTSKAARKHIEG